MKAKDILETKGSRVVTCSEENNLMEALSIFAANRIGSLLVVDDHDNIKGILAPRDILLVVLNNYEGFKKTRVKEIMSTNLIVAGMDDSVDYLQAIMTENKVRHLPIMEGPQLKGLLSIGDVVKAQIVEKEVENRYLKDYIEGKYPG